jgi:hypothetical protein
MTRFCKEGSKKENKKDCSFLFFVLYDNFRQVLPKRGQFIISLRCYTHNECYRHKNLKFGARLKLLI